MYQPYPQDQQSAAKEAAQLHSNRVGGLGGYPTPAAMPALNDASEGLDRSISEAMSLAEMLADRLSLLLAPAAPSTGKNQAEIARSYSPYVETVRRQRSRVDDISAQLNDLMTRLEV